MAFDPAQYTTTTGWQWQEDASDSNAWPPLVETWLGDASARMLELAEVAAPNFLIAGTTR